jgi:hypothetical protein
MSRKCCGPLVAVSAQFTNRGLGAVPARPQLEQGVPDRLLSPNDGPAPVSDAGPARLLPLGLEGPAGGAADPRAGLAARRPGRPDRAGIAVDETAQLKDGDATACVAPQHAGCTGHVENLAPQFFREHLPSNSS